MADDVPVETPIETSKAEVHMLPSWRAHEMKQKAHLEGIEKGKQMMQEQLQAVQQQTQQGQQPAQSMDGGSIQEQIMRAAQEIAKQQDEARMKQAQESKAQQDAMQRKQLDDEFNRRMSLGSTSVGEDFSKVVSGVNPGSFERTKYLATLGVPNTEKVMYELAKNPVELAGIENLATYNPELALQELLKKSKSIEERDRAVKQAAETQEEEPLQRMTSSGSTGVVGNDKSVTDWKNQYRGYF